MRSNGERGKRVDISPPSLIAPLQMARASLAPMQFIGCHIRGVGQVSARKGQPLDVGQGDGHSFLSQGGVLRAWSTWWREIDLIDITKGKSPCAFDSAQSFVLRALERGKSPLAVDF